MRISIFRKLLFIYLAISVISLIGLSLLINFMLEKQLRTEKEAELLKQASYLSERISGKTAEELLSKDFKLELKNDLRSLERIYNIRSTFIYNTKNTKKLANIGFSDVAESWSQTLFEGEQLFFTGKVEANGQELLALGTPVKLDEQVILVFILAMPIADLQQLEDTLQNSILYSFGAMVVIITLIIFWVSKRFVTPIHQMSDAAEKIASGHFDVRIPVRGSDELAQLANVLNQMTEKLHVIEQTRTRYISEVAHEFRTPLTTILGTIRAIMDRTIDEQDQQEFLQNAFTETKRISKLIDQLLELSKFEETKLEWHKERVSIEQIISQTVKQVEEWSGQKEISIDLQLEPNLFVLGDIDRLKQVMINLLENAIKHNSSGTRISIMAKANAQQVEIGVVDNGRGIAAEHLPYIFDRFYQVDSSRSTEGSGLGLAIVKTIIDQHGGQIQVESSEKGSIFSIKLSRMK